MEKTEKFIDKALDMLRLSYLTVALEDNYLKRLELAKEQQDKMFDVLEELLVSLSEEK